MNSAQIYSWFQFRFQRFIILKYTKIQLRFLTNRTKVKTQKSFLFTEGSPEVKIKTQLFSYKLTTCILHKA